MTEPTRSATDTTLVGRVLGGRYRVVAPLGEGGMGSVYVAEHLQLGRRFALKVLRDEHAGSEAFRQRFEREAKMLSKLSHPNVVGITDYGIDGELPFLVMELLEGRPLDRVLEAGPIPAMRALGLAKQLLRAVAHAHESGLVHRDLKPQNVVVRALGDGADHVTVLDFGLARSQEGGATLTQTGLVVGTPAYMAPEQAAGGQADARSDVYALGVLLFELFTGRRPFPQRDPSELLRAHLLTPAPALHDVAPELGAPPALEALVARALAKEPAARFVDAGAMRAALEEADPGRASTTGAHAAHADDAGSGAAHAGDPGATKAARPALAPDPTRGAGPGGAGAGPATGATKATRPAAAPTTGPEPARYDRPDAGAIAATPTERLPSRVPKPFREHRVLLLLGGGALLLAAALIVGLALLSGGEEEPAPAATTASAPRPASPAPETPRAPDEPEPAVWEAPPAEPIAELQRAILAGREPARRRLRALGVYARRHPEDARPLLLLAYTYVDRRWLSEGLEKYREAAGADVDAVRADARARRDLIELAATRTTHGQAVELIMATWGPVLRDEVARAEAAERDPGRRARLERLRSRLGE